MQNNQPVTQREFQIPDNATLMSTTDPHSKITYANDAFIEISGYSRDELQGQPHNVVRHPDMPKEAFADMWATLQGGEVWSALVKNRRKNGDHYWVRANATPVMRNGQLAGYLSVRTAPSLDQITQAEDLYRQFREGNPGGRRFFKGLIISSGLMRWRSAAQTMPVRWRIRSAALVVAPALILSGWMLGLSATSLAGFAGVTAAAWLLALWWLETQIAQPLEQLRKQTLRMAAGDTHSPLEMNRVDEIGMTMRAVNQLGLMLRWLSDDVSTQVFNVRNVTTEIAQGNGDLSSRTEQAATSVQQTASALEQMTASVKSNAETAGQANHLSMTASETAARGGKAVSDVVSTMNEISHSSRRIADIISVIDSIAFQTNILALNAAVEAARAGEQGRGFAVVASEVRGLAHRSAQAAKEIKDLISVSVDKVESGAKQVHAAGTTMDDIVMQVKRVSDLIVEISTASNEQSTGISLVGQAVGQLDQVTQQNAALVEQSAAASQSLAQQTTRLVEAVSVFR